MRVTKLIREYVEAEVEKAYAEKTPDEVAYDMLRKEIADFREKVNNEIYHAIEEAIARFCKEHNIPEDVKIFRTDNNLVCDNDWNSVIRNKSQKAKQQRAEQRDSKIKDILLNLELGATRAELDEMLSHLKD